MLTRGGGSKVIQGSGTGHKLVIRVLGIDSGLERPAVQLHIVLGDGQLFTSRSFQLPLHEIGA